MPIQFPTNPEVNQEYTYEGKVWAWDGSSWVGVRQETGIQKSNIWAKQNLLIPKRGFGLNSGYNGTTDQRRTKAGTIPGLKHYMERDLGEFINTVGVGWTPANLTSTACWLDAADTNTITLNVTTVSQWNDKSGNARHATQANGANQPTYISSGMNSLGLIDWDGSDDSMTISGGTTPLHTLLSADNTYSMAWAVKPDTISNQAVLLYVPEGSWKFLVEIKSDGGVYWGDTPSNYRTYSGGSFFVVNTGTFFTLIKTGSGNGTAHVGGTLNTSFTNNGGLGDTPALGAAFILGQYPGIFYNGKMAEIIISNYSWDTSERQKVEGYLAHKWGLQANLPNDHPYKSSAP
jgi:hypothetical protein